MKDMLYILIINDDEKENKDYKEAIEKNKSRRVKTTNSLHNGLKEAINTRYDLVLLDMQFDNFNGSPFDVAYRIKRERPSTLVFAFSCAGIMYQNDKTFDGAITKIGLTYGMERLEEKIREHNLE